MKRFTPTPTVWSANGSAVSDGAAMGEYAQYGGQDVKIGTCEDMYYLRYDQRWQVQALDGNVNPVLDVAHLRFRFPWPDEDTIPPGADGFHAKGYHRGLTVSGF